MHLLLNINPVSEVFGPSRIFALFDHRADSDCCLLLGTWTTEIVTVLLADALELADVAVCQDKNFFIQGFRITLRVLFFT